MRQTTSLFNRVCEFINQVPVGKTFTTKEYIATVGPYERRTGWKNSNNNKHYNCHQYKGYLGRTGFIKNTKRGEWLVQRHVPSWFDFGHLSILLSYFKWDRENRRNITTYKGMDKTAILEKLNASAIMEKNQRILATSVYGARIGEAVVSNASIAETARGLSQLVNEEVNKIAANENYLKTANKIDNSNEPRVETKSKKADRIAEITEMTENIIRLEQAFDLIGNCKTQDQFMRARLYNLQVIIQDITSAFTDKRDFLSNSNS